MGTKIAPVTRTGLARLSSYIEGPELFDALEHRR